MPLAHCSLRGRGSSCRHDYIMACPHAAGFPSLVLYRKPHELKRNTVTMGAQRIITAGCDQSEFRLKIKKIYVRNYIMKERNTRVIFLEQIQTQPRLVLVLPQTSSIATCSYRTQQN